ncbi:MAG: hypothetical protein U1U88_000872 [Lawsonella clevelandensis]
MRTAKAMSAAALALTIIAAPVTAHAASAPVTIMPGDTINTNYVVATGTCTAAAPPATPTVTGTSSLPATASMANWVSSSASPSISKGRSLATSQELSFDS